VTVRRGAVIDDPTALRYRVRSNERDRTGGLERL